MPSDSSTDTSTTVILPNLRLEEYGELLDAVFWLAALDTKSSLGTVFVIITWLKDTQNHDWNKKKNNAAH